MTPMNNLDIEEARQQIVKAAKDMLRGTIHPIEGCRIIARMRYLVGHPDHPVFSAIVGFESDTDGFPLGEARENYSAEYLRRLDAELAEHTTAADASIRQACREILAQFG